MKWILSNESADVVDWWLIVIILSICGFCDKREFLDQLINCKVFEDKRGCCNQPPSPSVGSHVLISGNQIVLSSTKIIS
jgi:hypothetical protein